MAAADDSGLIGWLAAHDAGCPVCGYALRGLKVPACPECNAALRMTVGADNARPGPWALAMVSLSMAMGFDLVVFTVMSVAMVIARFNPRMGAPPRGLLIAYFTFLVLGCACAAAAWMVYRKRAWWPRQVRSRQWQCAWGVFVLTGAVHLAWGATVPFLLQ